MNFINLLETLKKDISYDSFTQLQSDFMENDFYTAYKSLKPCKSTMQSAIKKYLSACTYKDEKTATYTTGVSALFLSAPIPEGENLKTEDLSKNLLPMMKNRRPADCYFFDSIALYKALKKQENKTYFLEIDGHFYNAAIIADLLPCVADNKSNYVSAEICENGALLMRQKNGALILPVVRDSCHVSENVNMQDFLRYCDNMEKSFFSKELKETA